jgi:HlyD family secretion protein
MSELKRVPVPLHQRLQDLRLRIVPALAFFAALAGLVVLWKDNLSAPTLVGQVEPYQASVSCYKPGMLAQLEVTRFQKVKAGDPMGQVLVTDPKILVSSLAVISAEIEALRAGMQPMATQQRTAVSYGELRLEWMRQRAQLAMAKINLQLAESEFHRTQELFKDKIVSQRAFEQAQGAQTRLQKEVDELNRLVEEQGKAFSDMEATNVIDMAKITDSPLRAAIAVQESKLRLTEDELSPIILKAPLDGMVSMVFHRSGEAVNAGEPIATIAAFNSVRIVGYLRAPVAESPPIGSRVEVRTRGLHRTVGIGNVVQVGTQVESITPALLGPVKLANLELGLPISVSLPPELKIMPGELVDLTLLRKVD